LHTVLGLVDLHLAAEQKNDWRKGSRKWKKE